MLLTEIKFTNTFTITSLQIGHWKSFSVRSKIFCLKSGNSSKFLISIMNSNKNNKIQLLNEKIKNNINIIIYLHLFLMFPYIIHSFLTIH